MKKYFVLFWLLLPLPVLVIHFSKGQQWMAQDRAQELIMRAQEAEKLDNWSLADDLYGQATTLIPTEKKDLKLRLDLARVRTSHRSGDAMRAIESADSLLDDAAFDSMPSEFRREARETAARIHYYAAWVMRLEGASRDLWMEQAELARQNFRHIAENGHQAATPAAAEDQKKNLESAIELQRLGLTDLMARPLPKDCQCMGGQNLSQKMGQRKGKGQGKGQGKCKSGGKPAKGGGIRRFEPGSGS